MSNDNEDLKEINGKIIIFLRTLANSIEQNQLLPEQLKKIVEFFISYNFWNQLENENETKEEFNDKEFMKFIFMGWYIYQNILPTNS